jgi:hypothetical protein
MANVIHLIALSRQLENGDTLTKFEAYSKTKASYESLDVMLKRRINKEPSRQLNLGDSQSLSLWAVVRGVTAKRMICWLGDGNLFVTVLHIHRLTGKSRQPGLDSEPECVHFHQ